MYKGSAFNSGGSNFERERATRRRAALAWPDTALVDWPSHVLGVYASKPGYRAAIYLNQRWAGRKLWLAWLELLYLHFALAGWHMVCDVWAFSLVAPARRRPAPRKTGRRTYWTKGDIIPLL